MKELKRLLPYVSRYPRPMLAGMAALVLAKAASVLVPLVLERTVDEMLAIIGQHRR
jgi:ABC-type multidrug transport system fused ATPase/permease subunit